MSEQLARRFKKELIGITDKKGIEIREGDILKGYSNDKDKEYIVTYHASDYSCGFVATDNADCNPYINCWYVGLYVVGSCYD